MRRTLAFAATLLVALALAASARAQYGGVLSLLSDGGVPSTTFAPNEHGTAEASGLVANKVYNLGFSQSPVVTIGTGTADNTGSVSMTFEIPATAHVGDATISLDPEGAAGTGPTTTIQIVEASTAGGIASTGSTPGLPITGGRIAQLSTFGLALIALGTVLMLSFRRRVELAVDGVLPVWFKGRNNVVAMTRGLSATRFGIGRSRDNAALLSVPIDRPEANVTSPPSSSVSFSSYT